jgi:hypothetical protein
MFYVFACLLFQSKEAPVRKCRGFLTTSNSQSNPNGVYLGAMKPNAINNEDWHGTKTTQKKLHDVEPQLVAEALAAYHLFSIDDKERILISWHISRLDFLVGFIG